MKTCDECGVPRVRQTIRTGPARLGPKYTSAGKAGGGKALAKCQGPAKRYCRKHMK